MKLLNALSFADLRTPLASDTESIYNRFRMSPEPKDLSFLVRLGATEAKMLADLAETTGLSRADVIRQAIRREHAGVFGSGPPRKAKKK
jgi:hypothetical protein